MKAVVYTEYGSPEVLRLEEVARPALKDEHVLVKIQAASVNMGDWYALTGTPFIARLTTGGLRKPKNTILGSDIAGIVDAVGRAVTAFKPGDAVYGDLSGCGLGGFADYVAVPAHVLAAKPSRLSFEEAAAVPLAGVTALQALRGIQTGQRVLIIGASGGVGTFAVQLAKAFGAHVTAVCSTGKVETVRALGTDAVIDYTREDFTRCGQRYDVILAVNGHRALSDYQRALNPGGVCVIVGGSMRQIFQAMLLGPLLSMNRRGKIVSLNAKPNARDLDFMRELLDAGKVAPVIDRCHPLSETAEALRYVGEGHARGKVIIQVAHPR